MPACKPLPMCRSSFAWQAEWRRAGSRFRTDAAGGSERQEYEGDARLFGENDDVVTLTSIHSAKGLQWDVVFWSDLSARPE